MPGFFLFSIHALENKTVTRTEKKALKASDIIAIR
jgi:hypothetical protein